MVLLCKSPFNGKTNKIIITALCFLLSISLIRIWFYNIQISDFKARLSDSFHTQAKSSLQYIYTCFLNSSQSFSSFVPSDIKTDIQYAIIIDAGSSGSRAYIYYWSTQAEITNTGVTQISQLVDIHDQPIIMKVSPGLTDYKYSKQAYEDGIKPLLSYVLQHIPGEQIPITPVYILATAGMRLIPTQQQNRILAEIELGIRRDFGFKIKSENVRVISGIDEGVYSWLAINYILKRLDSAHHNESKSTSTVGSLDMGGGSLQIAYEIPIHKTDGKFIQHLNFGINLQYKLYVNTYLNFGANQVRDAHFAYLINTSMSSIHNYSIYNQSTIQVTDPCLHENQHEYRMYAGRTVKILGSGNYNLCRKQLITHLKQDNPCPPSPIHCKMNGMYQAPIDFTNMQFYGFSEFWYTMDDVFNIGGVYYREKYDLSAVEYCSLDWSTIMDWRGKNLYPRADLNRQATQCFKSAWLSIVLHRGFGFPDDYNHLQSTDRIDGREIQWTMGALIYSLMQNKDTGLTSLSHIYKLTNQKLSHDLMLPVVFVLLAVLILFFVWYFLISKRSKKSGMKSYLPMLDSRNNRGHSRASSFPFPHTPSKSDIPRVTSNSSLRSILSLNGDRESSMFLNVEKVE
ncbi:Ectonucleoside triphosphate diphosphohydrolase 4 isoform X2 [Oopsacas minuta]|uniref:Ectonucleoside triphosphate diphosphohydrolase 4 isoform X2 n=1 Tax=Oopsacas minuta TaxID=111878 RepID=A0AAV7JX30_9METZ|nr:Ectonucleoside triphosphate diphosphohydrolase 4 isoform X2 [Oopsacas minuta]